MINNIATVGELIEYLQKNFKPDDKLCFWCEGGAYMSCEHLPKGEFGGMMFKYVGDDKKRRMEHFGDTKEQVDEQYEFVNDEDVLIY